MSKKTKADKIAEYTVIGKKENAVSVAAPVKKARVRRALFWSITAIVVAVTVTCLTLWGTGVFDELAKSIRNTKGGTVETDDGGYVDYSFKSSNMPSGYYATFTLVCESREYTFTAYLFSSYAPDTVANFLYYANNGYYNGTAFTEAEIAYGNDGAADEGYMLGGGYIDDGNGGFARKMTTLYNGAIKGEFAKNGNSGNKLSHTAGVISMARDKGYDTATTEFFILSYDDKELNGSYAAFAKITTSEGITKVQTLCKYMYEEHKAVTLKKITTEKK
jgi:cyclophilin family peptidyl-prolyl cis-trans isomerase